MTQKNGHACSSTANRSPLSDVDLDRLLVQQDELSAPGDEEPWTAPDMRATDGGRAKPPEFPVHDFGSWAEWISAVAEGCSAPPDFVAASLLTAAAGLIGNSRVITPWPSWSEPATLWTALIGQPSSGKSPAIAAVQAPLRKIESAFADEFAEQQRRYERDKAVAREKRDRWEGDVKQAVGSGCPAPDLPLDAQEPELPARKRLYVVDTTYEKLAMTAAQNPRGFSLWRDELAGLFENFSRYGGSDKNFYLEAFNARSYVVDRVRLTSPLVISHLNLSITGGCQPDRLKSLVLSGDDDGLAARFLYAWPDAVAPRRPSGSPDDRFAEHAFQRLLGLQMGVDEGKLIPIRKPLASTAVDLFQQWREQAARREKSAYGILLSALGKMPGAVLRLSLVLEYLEWAASGDQLEPTEITEPSLACAIDLVDNYFVPMAARAFGDASLPETERNAAALAREIRRRQARRINARHVRREWRLPGLRSATAVSTAIESLVDAGWLMPDHLRAGGGNGRPRLDFVVNHTVLDSERASCQ